MNCTKCGTKIPNGAKFCPKCGKKVINPNKPQQPAKCWATFNDVGYALSIAGLATFWIPLIGTALATPGLIFACLGKNDKARPSKQKKGFAMGLVGTILSVTILFVGMILLIVLPIIFVKK